MSTGARWRIVAALVAGIVCLQAAWILALRPFAGIDEFDHAFRAAAVAHGQFLVGGSVVRAPADIVAAANNACYDLHASRSRSCHPVSARGGTLVSTLSTAAHYNPVFYWVTGTPARLFSGADALYAMRVVAALLCAGCLGLAAWATTLWSRTRWPVVGLLAALLPEVMYTSIVEAPNGLEICAAAAFWCSLLGAVRGGLAARQREILIWSALPSAAVLGFVRQLGPLWAFLIVVTTVILAGRGRSIELLRDHRRPLVGAAAVTIVASLAGMAWSFGFGGFGSPGATGAPRGSSPALVTLLNLPVWLFQSVAAFPYRNQLPSAVALICPLIVGAALVILSFRRVHRGAQRAMAVVIALGVAVPSVITMATLSSTGSVAWQGRYTLPYTIGLLLICGFALDGAAFARTIPRWLSGSGAAALCAGQAAGVYAVWHYELTRADDFRGSLWATLPGWALVALVVAGWACWLIALAAADRDSTEHEGGTADLLDDAAGCRPEALSVAALDVSASPAVDPHVTDRTPPSIPPDLAAAR